MREIIFKAKRIDNGEWVEGDLIHSFDEEKRFAISNLEGIFEVAECTICQYTGLTDKNGNKIWENDVVNCPLEKCCGKVIWNENEALFAFAVLCEDGMFEEEYLYDFENYIEVIGNTFDNPELLKGSE